MFGRRRRNPYISVAELVAGAPIATFGDALSVWECLVGVAGFEPATPSSRTRLALSHLIAAVDRRAYRGIPAYAD